MGGLGHVSGRDSAALGARARKLRAGRQRAGD